MYDDHPQTSRIMYLYIFYTPCSFPRYDSAISTLTEQVYQRTNWSAATTICLVIVN